MYVYFRIFLVCVVSFFILTVNKHKIIQKNFLRFTYVCISLLLVIILCLFPFENLLFVFDSPGDAYKYIKNSSSIDLLIKGNHCDFIVDENKGSITHLIIPKTPDGYKIDTGYNTKIVSQKVKDNMIMYVYNYRDTKDYFVVVFNTGGKILNIEDQFESKFESLNYYNNSLKCDFFTYYAHISKYDTDYRVRINGDVYL